MIVETRRKCRERTKGLMHKKGPKPGSNEDLMITIITVRPISQRDALRCPQPKGELYGFPGCTMRV